MKFLTTPLMKPRGISTALAEFEDVVEKGDVADGQSQYLDLGELLVGRQGRQHATETSERGVERLDTYPLPCSVRRTVPLRGPPVPTPFLTAPAAPVDARRDRRRTRATPVDARRRTLNTAVDAHPSSSHDRRRTSARSVDHRPFNGRDRRRTSAPSMDVRRRTSNTAVHARSSNDQDRTRAPPVDARASSCSNCPRAAGDTGHGALRRR